MSFLEEWASPDRDSFESFPELEKRAYLPRIRVDKVFSSASIFPGVVTPELHLYSIFRNRTLLKFSRFSYSRQQGNPGKSIFQHWFQHQQ
ncbi:hypothetical protein MKX03_005561 [Papaver bracteatum]|nr:hypothetical protein MKX03_005561 [Papaver bracteatum]